jgi:TPR repeat protein
MSRVATGFFLLSILCRLSFGQLGAASVGELKLRAEEGDASAQDKLAESYLSSFYFTEATKWFLAAAEKGVVNSQWRLGQIYVGGKSGFPQRSSAVPADPKQGVRWLKKAAYVGHTAAQIDLARCYEVGKGVTKDNAEAYKWFGIAAKKDTILARGYHNQLALKMKPAEIQDGDRRIASFVVGTTPSVWELIELKGITGTAARRLAIVNSTTVGVGEQVALTLGGEKVPVTCENIGDQSVTLSVRGESRELRLAARR